MVYAFSSGMTDSLLLSNLEILNIFLGIFAMQLQMCCSWHSLDLLYAASMWSLLNVMSIDSFSTFQHFCVPSFFNALLYSTSFVFGAGVRAFFLFFLIFLFIWLAWKFVTVVCVSLFTPQGDTHVRVSVYLYRIFFRMTLCMVLVVSQLFALLKVGCKSNWHSQLNVLSTRYCGHHKQLVIVNSLSL